VVEAHLLATLALGELLPHARHATIVGPEKARGGQHVLADIDAAHDMALRLQQRV
jgi:hypothetical protein